MLTLNVLFLLSFGLSWISVAYLLNVYLLFRTDATRGRPWSWSLRKPSEPAVMAHRVEALTGPSPGRRSRIRMTVPAVTPPLSSSRMSTSLLVMCP
jgi:hypothetical protein